jgi:hypothetical protein
MVATGLNLWTVKDLPSVDVAHPMASKTLLAGVEDAEIMTWKRPS